MSYGDVDLNNEIKITFENIFWLYLCDNDKKNISD